MCSDGGDRKRGGARRSLCRGGGAAVDEAATAMGMCADEVGEVERSGSADRRPETTENTIARRRQAAEYGGGGGGRKTKRRKKNNKTI